MIKLHYTYSKGKCGKCGRPILVERLLFGTEHTANISVTCGTCLAIKEFPKEFVKEHPEAAKDIREWVKKSSDYHDVEEYYE